MSSRSAIENAIAGIRQDSPADGGPEPVTPDTDVTSDTSADDTPVETPDADVADESASAATPVAEKTAEKVEEKKPEDNDDVEKEPEYTTDAKGRKQENRIPQTRVKKMVEASVKRAVEAERAQATTKVAEFESRIKQYDSIGEIMEQDPDRFMSMLATINPGYQSYAKGGSAAASQQANPGAADEAMPRPDAQLADGTPAYSPEGHQRLIDWQERKIKNSVLSAMKEDPAYKWAGEVQQREAARAAAIPRIREQIAEAQSWEGFTENRDAILTALREDREAAEKVGQSPRLSLEGAYRKVMVTNHKAEVDPLKKEAETLKTDRNKTRQAVIAELNSTPKGTAAVPSTPIVPKQEAEDDDAGGSGDTRDIIRKAIAGLRR